MRQVWCQVFFNVLNGVGVDRRDAKRKATDEVCDVVWAVVCVFSHFVLVHRIIDEVTNLVVGDDHERN